ncbi:hypothetical protein V1511DRAFT_456148 [Dipodascopsis uninucleata]
MRLYLAWFGLLVLCQIVAAAWTEEDFEIFRLKEEVEKYEGKGTTFYSWLDLENGPKSSLDEINKAYRKKSRQLHPDKNPAAQSTEIFARLGVIANILRGPQKERYDFFLDRGFPRWKGTGYYYTRYRPGFISVLIFLFLISSAAHYVTLNITAKNERARIERYISECKSQAWPNGFPPADDSKRRIMFGNGMIFMVYSDGSVYFVDKESNQEYILDPNEIAEVTWRKTVLFGLPRYLWSVSLGRFMEIPSFLSDTQKADAKGQNEKKQSHLSTDTIERPRKKSTQPSGATQVLSDGRVVSDAAKVAGGRRRRRK